jgi:23S rRNA (pseudouridine1915-N3)-methyltransferase
VRAKIISLCDKLPAWVKAGFDDYATRLFRDLPLEIIDLPLSDKRKSGDLPRAHADECARMLARVPEQSRVIALDGKGELWSSEKLAQKLAGWRMDGRDICILIGGPEGHSSEVLGRAESRFSLGAVTLPHALVRIVIAEQLYRAHCILSGHPYHRG